MRELLSALVPGYQPAASQLGPLKLAAKAQGSTDKASISGLSLQEAIGAIEAAGLTPGQLYGPARGTPISTNPGEGAQVKRGSAVDIYLG